MEKKLLFMDLDGTLLDDEKKITPKNRAAIWAAVEMGHIVTIATGRPLISGSKVAEDLGFTQNGCYLVCFNGAVIYDMGKREIVSEETLDLDLVKILFDEAEAAGVYIQTYSHEKVLTRRKTPQLLQYYNLTGQPYEINPEFPKGIRPPNKVLLSDLDHSGVLERFQKEHRYLEGSRCHSFFSSREYLEYCSINASKGKALKKMAEIFGIPVAHTVAMGDEQNDESMIEAAGVGVVMKNGNPALFEIADYITEHDNNHDAVAEVIGKFLISIVS